MNFKCNITFIIFVVCVNSLFAQENNYNTEFQFNTYTDKDQASPKLCSLPDGGFVAVWHSEQDGSGYGIYFQVYNSDFSKRDDEVQVNTYTDSYQTLPSISILSDGGFVIVWQSYDQDSPGYGIYGQVFNPDFSRKGGEFHVNTYTENYQNGPSVSRLTDDGFVIVWTSFRQDGSAYGVFGQAFNSDLNRRGEEFQVNTYTYDSQSGPSLCSLADTGFVVVWNSKSQDGSEFGIYGQAYNLDLSRRGSEFQVNTHTNNNQVTPSIISLTGGGFVIVWSSYGQDSRRYGIYGQVFNSNFSRRGEEFRISSYTDHWQMLPLMGNSIDGGFVVVWQSDSLYGSYQGVYSQLFNKELNAQGKEFRINSVKGGRHLSPSVCTLPNGEIVYAWERGDEFNADIIGKYYLKDPIIHELINYELLKPGNDKSILMFPINFEWEIPSDIHINFPWEIEYALYISENESFENPIVIKEIQDTTFQIGSLTADKTYFWKVLTKTYFGDSLWSSNINEFYIDSIAVSLDENEQELPTEFELSQNYPNPFNPTTTIKYQIPQTAFVSLSVFNILGEKIAALINKVQTAGDYTIDFDASSLPSGVYLYRVQADKFSETKKMVLLR